MIKISFQKRFSRQNEDDVIRITKGDEYGSYDVSIHCFNGDGTANTATFDVYTLYEYIDNLFNVFVMDTQGMDDTVNLSAQIDITGFPSFLVDKEGIQEHRDNINRAIEFWAEA